MSSAVAKHIFSFLCKNEGCSDYGMVDKSLRQSFTVADEVLSMVLDDREKFAIKEDDDSKTNKSVLGAKSLIVAKTSLRVCKNDKCEGCEELHLCRYLVCGNCRFGWLAGARSAGSRDPPVAAPASHLKIEPLQ